MWRKLMVEPLQTILIRMLLREIKKWVLIFSVLCWLCFDVWHSLKIIHSCMPVGWTLAWFYCNEPCFIWWQYFKVVLWFCSFSKFGNSLSFIHHKQTREGSDYYFSIPRPTNRPLLYLFLSSHFKSWWGLFL
jgi:hypothetical protein